MALTSTDRAQIEAAIGQIRSDLADLEAQIPTWENLNTNGTKIYRPISKRITAAVKRLDALVNQHTYSN